MVSAAAADVVADADADANVGAGAAASAGVAAGAGAGCSGYHRSPRILVYPYLCRRDHISTHVRAQSMLHAVLVCISAGILQVVWQVCGGLWGEVGVGSIVRLYDKSRMFFWHSDQLIPLWNGNSIPVVIPGIQVAIFNSYAE